MDYLPRGEAFGPWVDNYAISKFKGAETQVKPLQTKIMFTSSLLIKTKLRTTPTETLIVSYKFYDNQRDGESARIAEITHDELKNRLSTEEYIKFLKSCTHWPKLL